MEEQVNSAKGHLHALSGLKTCVTDQYQDLGDAPPRLVEISVVEQRYHAVLAVQASSTVTEVAERFGVCRQTVHEWLARYRDEG